jgi:hypothetical protein
MLGRANECNGEWLLKNSFGAFSAKNSACKLLNFRSTRTPKFVEIIVLVRFSAATGFFIN